MLLSGGRPPAQEWFMVQTKSKPRVHRQRLQVQRIFRVKVTAFQSRPDTPYFWLQLEGPRENTGKAKVNSFVLLLPISSGQILFLTPEQLVIPEVLSLGPAARLAGSWPPSLQIFSPSSVPLLPSFSSAPPLSCMSHLPFKGAGITSAQSLFLTRAFSGQKRALIFHLGISLRACISVASATYLFVLSKTLKGLHPFFLFKSWAVSLSTRTGGGP